MILFTNLGINGISRIMFRTSFWGIPAFRVKSDWQAPKESWGRYIEGLLSELWDILKFCIHPKLL